MKIIRNVVSKCVCVCHLILRIIRCPRSTLPCQSPRSIGKNSGTTKEKNELFFSLQHDKSGAHKPHQ